MVAGKAPRVLFADDDAEVRAVVRSTLQSHGWTVYEAATPAATLDLAFHEQPDGILLDVVFRQHSLDGLGVCRKLREAPLTRNIPIVMLAADSTAADREQAVAAGATAYLTKPFRAQELVRALSDALGVGTPDAPRDI